MTVTEYLRSLGRTPIEVADALRKRGIRGKRQSRTCCPILNGIYEACPDYWPGLRIVNGDRGKDGNWTYVATLGDVQIIDPVLPQPVMNFIGNFDTGMYRDLEEST